MFGIKRNVMLTGGVTLLTAALITTAVAVGTRSSTAPVTVPEETPIHVTLDQGVSSNQNRPGDHFEATISQPVVLHDHVVIPEGTPVEGMVVDARPSGKLMGRAHLELALQTMQLDGQIYDITTTRKYRLGRDHKKRNWAWIGGGAGSGALIGAAAAGGEGALIGGPIGAGAGLAVTYFTGRKDIHLAPETPLEFHLSQPLTLTTKS